MLLFDPTNPTSSAYNPLLEVRRGDKEVRDVQNIADILVDPEGALDKRNHWEKTSHSLLVGAILHVLYAEADKTLAGVANFLSDPKRPVEATLRAMMNTPHLGEAGVHPVIASSARELLNKSDNERSGVLSTAMSFLGLYRDPVVAKVTARCDWRIADLVSGDRPVSLYLVVPPSDINRTKPLIRLLLNQVGRRLTEDLTTSANRHRLLLMLDEFPALGRLDFFESALAFMAGYGIKSFLIAQSLNQIEKAYGANNSVLDNCHVRVAFATNDERTAKRVSDALGTATEMRDSTNYAGHRLSPWLGHLMVSRQETARPLLTPGEVMQLPPADELLLVAGVPPVRAKKARYYEDARFRERIMPPPKSAATKGSAKPPTDDWSALAIPTASAGVTANTETGPITDPANAGIRREPELPEHEEIAPPSVRQLESSPCSTTSRTRTPPRPAAFVVRSHLSPGRRQWTRPMASSCSRANHADQNPHERLFRAGIVEEGRGAGAPAPRLEVRCNRSCRRVFPLSRRLRTAGGRLCSSHGQDRAPDRRHGRRSRHSRRDALAVHPLLDDSHPAIA